MTLVQGVSGRGAGLDIDRDALSWGLAHNGDGLVEALEPRLCLLQGDVRCPLSNAELVLPASQQGSSPAVSASDALSDMRISGGDGHETHTAIATSEQDPCHGDAEASLQQSGTNESQQEPQSTAHDCSSRPADIICAFNFSVCLLHRRPDVQVAICLPV